MEKFKIIIEDVSEIKIQEIDMSEMIEGDVKNNDVIEKYINPKISQFTNDTEYIVKVLRTATEEVIIVKDIKISENKVVFL